MGVYYTCVQQIDAYVPDVSDPVKLGLRKNIMIIHPR